MKSISSFIILCHLTTTAALFSSTKDGNHILNDAIDVVGDILKNSLQSECFVMFMTSSPSVTDYSSITEVANNEITFVSPLEQQGATSGFAFFHLDFNNESNATGDGANPLSAARKLRRIFGCVSVVFFSDDPIVLMSFAKESQKCRFLVWTMQLIIVTHLPPQQLLSVLSNQWTFSMMNAHFLNAEGEGEYLRWKVYAHLPYTLEGPKEIVVASWQRGESLRIHRNRLLFPEKHFNFYGTVVNVTSLHYPPYWIEEEHIKEDGSKEQVISGTDGMLLHAVAQALNFTFYNIPTKDWNEVLDKVVDGESLISPILWAILPERLARFDMTYVYTWTSSGFCKAKPPLEANWEGLKDPLSNEVWFGVLVSVLLAPGILYAIMSSGRKLRKGNHIDFGVAVLETIGRLLGQSFPNHLPKALSGRLLLASWLIFTFIIGVSYKGSLTAHLTLPKYPPRPESVEELVEAVDIVTGASYIGNFREFFSKSDFLPYQKLSTIMTIGIGAKEGMRRALKDQRSALMDIPAYMEHLIATQFTRTDGSTDLYIGKSSLLPGQAGWPVPHDAPFKVYLDKSMQSAIEAGLYTKWSSDLMEKARRESMQKQRSKDESQGGEIKDVVDDTTSTNQDDPQALSLSHVKAPIIFFLGGLGLGIWSFVIEILIYQCVNARLTSSEFT